LVVSYKTITGTAPCPNILTIPVCYLVGVGYFLMLLAQTGLFYPLRNKIFYCGWGVVFGIACIGVGLELSIGDICPKSSAGMPLCYISFAFCLAIVILRLILSRFGKSSVLKR